MTNYKELITIFQDKHNQTIEEIARKIVNAMHNTDTEYELDKIEREKLALEEEDNQLNIQICKYYEFINRQTHSQHIYQWDNQGNALWERRFYVRVSDWSLPSVKYFYFRAYQTKAGGGYNFEAPVEINAFPKYMF